MSRALEAMSRDELAEELQRERNASCLSPGGFDRQIDLMQELRAYQIELELQNRALCDAQHLLEESQSRYADLFDYAPVGYLTLDRGGIIEEMNFVAAGMLGRNRSTMIGLPLSAAVPRESLRAVLTHVRRCVDGESEVQTDIQLTDARGCRRLIHVLSTRQATPMRPLFWPTCLTDVTVAHDRWIGRARGA